MGASLGASLGASYDGLLQTEQRFSLSKVRFGIAWSCKRRIAVDTAPPPKAEYALLVEQVEEAQVNPPVLACRSSCDAQAVLGDDRVKIVEELGSVKMVIDVFELLDAEIATKLGFFDDSPVFVTICYDRSSKPSISCTQLREPGFGVQHHLKVRACHSPNACSASPFLTRYFRASSTSSS